MHGTKSFRLLWNRVPGWDPTTAYGHAAYGRIAYGHRQPTGADSLRAPVAYGLQQPTGTPATHHPQGCAGLIHGRPSCSSVGYWWRFGAKLSPGPRPTEGAGQSTNGPGKTKGPKGLARGRGATWQSWGIRASRALRRSDREDNTPISIYVPCARRPDRARTKGYRGIHCMCHTGAATHACTQHARPQMEHTTTA